ncbi:hypothetical protein [Rhodococcus opacus]|uniref:Hypothetical membrane protein n=1 Tax=Rhodococcus opacus (strain B4) TaxID=632772 RepID=C1BEE8_RHOOB|nr:hypothetical protein [Rhodococcus opacus]BAH56188.1 hypothetical membrane protein [Rhodococcus opacus B4]
MLHIAKFRREIVSLSFTRLVAVTGNNPVTAAAAAVREAVAAKGIDEDTLNAMLRTVPARKTDADAIHYCFNTAAPVPTRAAMRRVVEAVEELDLGTFESIDLISPVTRLVRHVRDVAAGALFAFCLYLVLGAVLTGQNAMANHTSTAFVLGALAVCLGLLALLEAAHIAAVALSTADVSQLRESHSRVFKLHPFVATSERLEHYLAGRQAGVVLVVFGIAEVTRTAGMTSLPFTSIGIPHTAEILLGIGVPGALIVLCIGQVAPQLVAARKPAGMMNTLPMAGAFTVTRWIANLGLATPSKWLMAGFPGTERIATAPRQRYLSDSLDAEGFGVESIAHQVIVGAQGSIARSLTTTVFTQAGRTTHGTTVAVTTRMPRTTASITQLRRGAEALPVVVTGDDSHRTSDSEGYIFTETHAPRIGTFEANDVLHTAFKATFDDALTTDRVVISAPTRLAIIRVVLEHPSAPLPPARLSITHVTNAEIAMTSLVCPTMHETDNSVEFVAIVKYPTVGSVITLDWSREELACTPA